MYALIDPYKGNTVIDIKDTTYPVDDLQFWVECPDNCKKGLYFYVYVNEFFELIPPNLNVPLSNIKASDNKSKAIYLLTCTDWVTFPDVINTSITPHLLNQDEFIEYRRQLRIISLDPIDGSIDWPVIPNEKWAK